MATYYEKHQAMLVSTGSKGVKFLGEFFFGSHRGIKGITGDPKNAWELQINFNGTAEMRRSDVRITLAEANYAFQFWIRRDAPIDTFAENIQEIMAGLLTYPFPGDPFGSDYAGAEATFHELWKNNNHTDVDY